MTYKQFCKELGKYHLQPVSVQQEGLVLEDTPKEQRGDWK